MKGYTEGREVRGGKMTLYLNYGHHELKVTGSYVSAEKASWSEWDGGDPGCSEGIEDLRVFVCQGKREREVPEKMDLGEIENAALEELSDQ